MSRTLIRAALVAALTLPLGTAPAQAGSSVDPSTLQPVPPPGATCTQDGLWVICHTLVQIVRENEPVFELQCGQVYENSTDTLDGTRCTRTGCW